MEADPFPIGAVFKDAKRFVVPIYQRTYTWRIKPHLETFFDQAEAKAEERLNGNAQFPHYIGALLVIPRGTYTFGKMVVFDVVDGQQRLTTLQIFLAALRDLAREYEQNSLADLLGSYLVNQEGPELHEYKERYKLYPTPYDRQLFCDLIDLDGEALREKYPDGFYKNGKVHESAQLPLRAWGFFRGEAENFANAIGESARNERLTALSAALLEHFRAIVITLDPHDDAQVIFETLNAGGAPLSAMDLVRNDVFHRATKQGENVEVLMEQRWAAFEDPFWKEDGRRGRIKKPRIDFFLNDTLAAETGKEVLLTELYAHYKAFVTARSFPSVDAELSTLLKHAPTFRMLTQPTGQSPLAIFARHLATLEVSTAYPLVFLIAESDLENEEKARLYQLVISYVVRRLLCGMTAKNYNNVFLRIAAEMKANGVSFTTGVNAFKSLEGDTVRFPSDQEFRGEISSRRQYGNMQQLKLRHILSQLEYAARDKFDEATMVPEDLTIEHILPDKWPEFWPLADGTYASSDLVTGMSESQLSLIKEREGLKHTLGNLTLLNDARNPSLGKLGFDVKREKLAASLLRLNKEISSCPTWSESTIRMRADRLGELALKVWPGLPLSP